MLLTGIANVGKGQVRGMSTEGCTRQAPCGKDRLQARKTVVRMLQEPCRCHSGCGWCLQDEAMGNPLVFSNFWFSFLKFFFLYDNFNFAYFCKQ